MPGPSARYPVVGRELLILDRLPLSRFVTMLDDRILQLEHEQTIDHLLSQDQLTMAQLNELAAAGFIESAQGIAAFLHPDIHWIAPTEYGEAFEANLKDEPHE